MYILMSVLASYIVVEDFAEEFMLHIEGEITRTYGNLPT